jgi:AraC family transcriptional regulator of adaptative response / DNA-3-methyladenine glycosylase II
LLDDTDLTITEIAFASGFGSVRQLNRACVELFQATPTQLRARRRSTDRLIADGGLTLRLPFTPPLDWDTMLAYFAARAIGGVEHVSDGSYRRTVRIDGDPGVLEIARGGDDHLLLRAHLPHLEGLIHVVQRARRIFNLDSDPAPAGELFAADPTLAPLLLGRPGLRVPGTWDAFETGVRAIVGQQVSVAGANTIVARIVERIGTPVPGLQQLGLTHLFPEAATLANADLDGLGLTTARAGALRTFAAAVDDGRVVLDGSTSLERFVAAVSALPGLGPWTAHYLALRLGEPDAFPASDLGLRRALSDTTPLSATELAEVAEQWRPWRAYAAVHLWMSSAASPRPRVAVPA